MPPRRSTIARIQQFTTLALLVCAAGWLTWEWPQSRWMALTGATLIVFGYAAVLALEFVALRRINRGDPAPAPAWNELARAWMAEILQAPRVFCWRQPFRSGRVPDRLGPSAALQGRRGVVFIHGFLCNRGFWTPWLELLAARNRAFAAVNLEPVFGSIDEYVPVVEQAIAAVTQASGLPPVVVCHSMGGLAARAWLRAGPHAARVHHLVTIGTPHRGTWLGQFSHAHNGRQMALGSDWLRGLQEHFTQQTQPPITCWYSNCDNVVFPASTATLAGARNVLVPGAAHVDLAFHPEVIAATLASLERL